MLCIVPSQYFDWVLLYFVDVHHDNIYITGLIYFCKRIEELYSFFLADFYFLVLKKINFWLNMRHKLLKMLISYILNAPISLTFSWRRPLSYRNQSIDLLRKSIDWFLYDIGLRHERVKKRSRVCKLIFNILTDL